MGLRVSFELDDDDLKHFRLVMKEARRAAARIAPEDIVEAAEELLAAVASRRVPGFVSERLDKLRLLIEMLSDVQWRLPQRDARRVLNALAYFTDPDDLIPDHVPGLGLLDDAIMVELVVRELKHEIDAYQDFCDFRTRTRDTQGRAAHVSRDKWLENRRKELLARMRRRRTASGASGRGGSGTGLLS